MGYIDIKGVDGLNLYCYCGNDPINKYNLSGHVSFFVITAIIGAVAGFGLAAYNDYKDDNVWFNGSVCNYIGYILGGAVIGTLVGAGAKNTFSSILGRAVGRFIANYVPNYMFENLF